MSRLIQLLMADTGLNESDIRTISHTAPKRYKIYSIPKRNGGFRQISQPAKEVKILQRALIGSVLSKLPVHHAAMAYQQGRSIRNNADYHVKNGPILKIDFVDFFPSIRGRDWLSYCDKNSVFDNDEDKNFCTKILFQGTGDLKLSRLAIGAPSSPILSNVIMFNFDLELSSMVARDHVLYTRYADDLTFSAGRTGYLVDVEKSLRSLIHRTETPKLTINDKKTTLATKKYKRFVTGLVLSNAGDVSLGNEKKRKLRAMLHYASLGKLTLRDLAKLSGYIAFVNDVEPSFNEKMKKRYGSELFNLIKRVPRSSA